MLYDRDISQNSDFDQLYLEKVKMSKMTQNDSFRTICLLLVTVFSDGLRIVTVFSDGFKIVMVSKK